jgi:glycosyltransferase involved in cell wall biosynthesis
MISVMIPTLNEEMNLPACLGSVRWCDDIVVLDSCSTDRTVEIAEAAGARVFRTRMDSESDRQNWALKNIDFKHPWLYHCDADEIVTQELQDEMLSVVASDPECVAYRVRYKNYFLGKWIKHCGIYPTWVMRLFRPEAIRFTRRVNTVPIVAGPEGKLQGHFLHYSFNKGLDAWFEKHNKYSHGEAMEALHSLSSHKVDWRGLVAWDPVRRRLALKELSFRLPFRPTLRFLYMYLWRRGFLDGHAGLTYCRLLALYEFMIVVKTDELRRARKGNEPSEAAGIGQLAKLPSGENRTAIPLGGFSDKPSPAKNRQRFAP